MIWQLSIVTAEPHVHGVRELCRAVAECGRDAVIIDPYDNEAINKINQSEVIIFRLSPSLYWQYRQLVLDLIEPHKTQLERVLLAYNKVDSTQLYQAHDIPIPDTIVVHQPSDIVYKAPSVFKVAVGHQGVGVKLAKNKEEFDQIAHDLLQTKLPFIQQEYIVESVGRDKRLFMVGDTMIAAMQRQAKSGEFRANLSQGGDGETFQPSAQELEIARLAMCIHKLTHAGVDLIDSRQGPLLLEVNPSPGFAISKVTGVDAAGATVRQIMI